MSAARCSATRRRKRDAFSALARAVRRPLLPRAAAARAPRRRANTWMSVLAWRRSAAMPVVATNDVRFVRAAGFRIARGARLHPGRRAARRSRAARRYTRAAIPALAARNGRAVRRHARSAREFGRDRAALQLRVEARRIAAAGVPGARRASRIEDYLRGQARARLRSSDCSGLDAHSQRGPHRACDTSERLAIELGVICQMGFAGYFLIVADFIRWARENGVPVGPGPRLGRRLAGGVQPRHHRSRSAAIRPAVRALPESRARIDAGLRHRLLHGRPRPRHRYVARDVRPRARLADHHLRHHGREGGGARRRPRARA